MLAHLATSNKKNPTNIRQGDSVSVSLALAPMLAPMLTLSPHSFKWLSSTFASSYVVTNSILPVNIKGYYAANTCHATTVYPLLEFTLFSCNIVLLAWEEIENESIYFFFIKVSGSSFQACFHPINWSGIIGMLAMHRTTHIMSSKTLHNSVSSTSPFFTHQDNTTIITKSPLGPPCRRPS